MRVCVFVVGAFYPPEKIDAISGHVQIPLMAAKILSKTIHDVTLITTKADFSYILPENIYQSVSVKIIEHASRKWPAKGTRPLKAIKQYYQLFSFLKRESFDIVHFFGGNNTGLLLICLKIFGINSYTIFTPIKALNKKLLIFIHKVLNLIFGSIDQIITTTEYVRHSWSSIYPASKTSTIYPGITKKIHESFDTGIKNSVLFWRNANYSNGADLAIQAYRELGLEYPDTRFVFAVRPHDVLEEQLSNLEKCITNIDLHIYPYKNGMSIEKLLQNALFVIHPFRSLSINPQISILETLYSGVPVITTKIESNEELIVEGKTGILIQPNDKNALISAMIKLLDNKNLCYSMSKNARVITELNWNWNSFGKKLINNYEEIF